MPLTIPPTGATMLLQILLGVAVLIALFLIYVALKPGDFAISRSATFHAPAQAVYDLVSDLRRWNDWSPWAKLDPDAKYTLEGPPSGVGAKHSWNGNSKVGQGSMTIVEAKPAQLIRCRLEFIRPFKCTNAVEFAFASQGDQTTMSWTMTGKSNFMSKIFCTFMNMDKMVGGDFEKGLASLRTLVEKK